MKAACTDEEFLALWERHQSTTKIAKLLDISVRRINSRRRHIEAKFGIKLQIGEEPVKALHKPVQSLTVTDGHVICFSDAHFWPGIRTTAFKALLWFIKQFNPLAIVDNGDSFDGARASRYPRIGWDKTPSIKQELDCCVAAHSEIEEVAGNAQLFWNLGNHDARFENVLAQHAPEFEGIKGFSLKDHFPRWAGGWRLDINDDVVVKHRMKSGIHAPHNNTKDSGKSLVTGHLHSAKVMPWSDYRGTRYGVDLGTLADPDGPQFVNYTEAGPLNWRSAFGILSFKDGRLLMPQLVQRWDDGKVEFAGQIIDVSKE